jgi:predicted nicotinamide N-methyase
MSNNNPASVPPFPETPLDAIHERIHENVIVEGRIFKIMRPADSDRLLDDPALRAAFAVDEYMPYWTDLWPAARMLAKALMRETWSPGLNALEVGCGLGLPGIVALAQGMHVTFSDYDATALKVAAENARANGFNDFKLLQLDWRRPPADMCVPVVLGSDLVYEARNVAPLVKLIRHVLAPEGVCLLADQDRIPTELLRDSLTENGLAFTVKVMHAGEPGGRRLRGALYRITHRSQSGLSLRGEPALR